MNIEPTPEEVQECYILSEVISKVLSGREGAAVLSTLTMVLVNVMLQIPREDREKVIKNFIDTLRIGINTLGNDFPGPN